MSHALKTEELRGRECLLEKPWGYGELRYKDLSFSIFFAQFGEAPLEIYVLPECIFDEL